LTGSQYFIGTLNDAATGLVREIVKVTAISGDSLTVVRGQEGTTAVSWLSGDYFANQWSAGQAAQALQVQDLGSTLTGSMVTTALGYTPASSANLVPTASIIMYAASSPPTGYLECNGAGVSTTTYAALFAVIGYTYGGSGATFNVPDFRGYFPRGWSHGSTVDSGRSLGSTQGQQMQGHIHPLNGSAGVLPASTTGNGFTGSTGTNVSAPVVATGEPVNDGTNGAVPYGNETRPINLAVMFLIKT